MHEVLRYQEALDEPAASFAAVTSCSDGVGNAAWRAPYDAASSAAAAPATRGDVATASCHGSKKRSMPSVRLLYMKRLRS